MFYYVHNIGTRGGFVTNMNYCILQKDLKKKEITLTHNHPTTLRFGGT